MLALQGCLEVIAVGGGPPRVSIKDRLVQQPLDPRLNPALHVHRMNSQGGKKRCKSNILETQQVILGLIVPRPFLSHLNYTVPPSANLRLPPAARAS